MSTDLPPVRHLGAESIWQALAHRNVELDEDDFGRVRDAVENAQEVLEAELRPRYEAGEEGFEEVYVAEPFYERAVRPPAEVRETMFGRAGVRDPELRKAVQYTHRAEASRTGQYGGKKSKKMFVLVDESGYAAPVAE